MVVVVVVVINSLDENQISLAQDPPNLNCVCVGRCLSIMPATLSLTISWCCHVLATNLHGLGGPLRSTEPDHFICELEIVKVNYSCLSKQVTHTDELAGRASRYSALFHSPFWSFADVISVTTTKVRLLQTVWNVKRRKRWNVSVVS